VARKRVRYQVDRRRRRKRKPAPKVGWLLVELCPLVGIAPRTVREYLRLGLLTRPVFRGRATRYQRHHLIRLLAIKLLRIEHARTSSNAILAHLERFNPAELEAWVLARPISARVREALTRDAEAQNTVTAVAQAPLMDSALTSPSLAQAAPNGATEWHHSALLPGLQLSIHAGAGTAARKVFEHLQCEFRAFIERSIA
jgi:DNA-binding transcriptional MerR regulator